MQRAVVALLLLAVLAGQLSMLEALLGRHYARQQMQHQIAGASQIEDPSDSLARKSEIQHLTFTRAERHSPNSSLVLIDDHEFQYRGALYDIVHEEWQGDVWNVWVLRDRQEEEHLEALAKVTGASTLEDSAVPPQQRTTAYYPIALVPATLALPPSPVPRSRSLPHISSTPSPSPYLEVPHPPPWG